MLTHQGHQRKIYLSFIITSFLEAQCLHLDFGFNIFLFVYFIHKENSWDELKKQTFRKDISKM